MGKEAKKAQYPASGAKNKANARALLNLAS
jgi:hypothetical protein